MAEASWKDLVVQLTEAGVQFISGLTDDEVDQAENSYCLHFPPDLRAFLQTAMPIGVSFPNWRLLDDEQLRNALRWPLHSFQFDVERNEFWLPEWGVRPDALTEALELSSRKIAEAPNLIPIYAHRYIPELPCESGNPVLSVYQTDVIYYGFDLDDYCRHEFNLGGRKRWPEDVKQIAFWEPERFQQIRE